MTGLRNYFLLFTLMVKARVEWLLCQLYLSHNDNIVVILVSEFNCVICSDITKLKYVIVLTRCLPSHGFLKLSFDIFIFC